MGGRGLGPGSRHELMARCSKGQIDRHVMHMRCVRTGSAFFVGLILICLGLENLNLLRYPLMSIMAFA